MNDRRRQDVRQLSGAVFRSPRAGWFRISLLVLLLADSANAADGQEVVELGFAPLVLRSSRFALRTDLPRAEAEQTLARLETCLKFVADYWRCKPRGQIDCYVVHNLAAWPDAGFPHALARVWIGGVGGATICEYEDGKDKGRVKATIYAGSQPGIAEHETIHAYCYQTFGEAGPDWYKEGMAQLAACQAFVQPEAGCSPAMVQVLAGEGSRTIAEIVQAGRFTNDLHVSFGAMLADRVGLQRHVPLNAWSVRDADSVDQLKQHYLWSWALCHMLLNNPNYATQFRMLGDGYLANGRETFQDHFAAMGDEVKFEYAFFLKHLDVGYRVDLCHWNWRERFRTLDQHGTVNRNILAARGYQASGLTVSRGQSHDYACQGTWTLSPDAAPVDADGDASGRGKMVGVVLTDFVLSEPFELGARGTFVAPATGNLYLRCGDAWNELGDNRGEILIRFMRRSASR